MGMRGPYRKRDEVREEILQAAEELLAERAPSEVTVRDVAERAGVQHSLVHRHFETKESLVAEVVRRTVDSYASAVRDTGDTAASFIAGMAFMADHRASFAAMTRALMEPDEANSFDLFPGFDVHLRRLAPELAEKRGGRLARRDDGTVDPRVLVMALMAFTSGWAFLEDRWLAAGGFTARDRTAVRSQIATLIEHLVENEAPSD